MIDIRDPDRRILWSLVGFLSLFFWVFAFLCGCLSILNPDPILLKWAALAVVAAGLSSAAWGIEKIMWWVDR